MARQLNFPLTEICIRPDIEEGLNALVEALDEPMADSSALPNYWVSRAAREKVKVALTGIGGDEVFGGYPRYLGAKLLRYYQMAPKRLRSLFAGFSPIFREQISSRNLGSWARRFLAYGTEIPEHAYAAWMGHLSPSDKKSIYTDTFTEAGDNGSAIVSAFENAVGDELQKILAVDLKTYLPEDLLTHADRVSMAVGLELRVPLSDQRLVEFALSLPSNFRVSGLTLKPLLKALLKDKLPLQILEQRKQGFMVPIGVWFKSELAPLVSDSMSSLANRGFFRQEGLNQLFEEHRAGRKRNRTDILWAIVLFERWLRKYHPDFKL
jgi:asparagine synthase (glutamine-hydrolysing)